MSQNIKKVFEKQGFVRLKGVLNFIDLANINSCSFIATEDIGQVYSNNSFEVLP